MSESARKRIFLHTTFDKNILRFGEFITKFGRPTPFFFNSSGLYEGDTLRILASLYAQVIIDSGLEFDMLFGPAYKGIALACATALALSADHHINKPFSFSRKVKKERGEKGWVVGPPLQGKVLIIDDVLSAGTSVRESAKIIKDNGAQPCAVLVGLNRMERGQGGKISTAEELKNDLGLPVFSIVTLDDIITFASTQPELSERIKEIEAYRAVHGA
jgi:orotate phosphoribosyltransferase